MSEKKKFDKSVLNLEEKIKLLKDRGLIIDDEEKAKHDLYSFDRTLRLLTLDAIEKIEVSLKSNINYALYKYYGAFWYLNKNLFYLKSEKILNIYDGLLDLITVKQTNSSSIFVKLFFEKYEGEYLPSWMLFEELTIGEVSNIYRILKGNIQKNISGIYLVDFIDFNNWIQLIRTIRNISAHQARLWNREYIIKLSKDDKTIGNKLQKFTNGNKEVIPNFYNTALVLTYLLKKINKNFSWLDDLKKLFKEFPNIEKEKMGFYDKWELDFETKNPPIGLPLVDIGTHILTFFSGNANFLFALKILILNRPLGI